MDFYCIEVLLSLPEFRVIYQVLGPQQLELHLERRDIHIVCPQCGTCCSRLKESGPRASVTCPSSSILSCCGCICGVLDVQIAIIALEKGVNLIDNGKKIWVMVFCNGDIANIPNV